MKLLTHDLGVKLIRQHVKPVYSVVDFRPAEGLWNRYANEDGSFTYKHCPGWLMVRHTHDEVHDRLGDGRVVTHFAVREHNPGDELDDVQFVAACVEERGRLERADGTDTFVDTVHAAELGFGTVRYEQS